MNTPELAIGDGAMGFWAALEEVYPVSRQQSCWMHKTMNVLNCLPKSGQAKAKQALHNIWQAATKVVPEKAFDLFIKTYEPKYPKATACPTAPIVPLNSSAQITIFRHSTGSPWRFSISNPIDPYLSDHRAILDQTLERLSDSMTACCTWMFRTRPVRRDSLRRRSTCAFDYLVEIWLIGIKFKDGVEVTQVDQVAA